MTKNTSIKKLNIEGKYNDFSDFYDVNKVIIYNNILKLFENFKNKEKEHIILRLSANIENIEWKTNLEFSREDIYVLERDILPYFEELEEYETCDKITKLYESIK